METKVHQLEVTKKPYMKINKDEQVVEKVSEKADWTELSITFEEIYSSLMSLKKLYTSHKYQVYNDQFHWPKTLD